MKAIILILTTFTFSIYAENCEVKLKKFCPSGERQCVEKNYKVIGNKCYYEFFVKNEKNIENEMNKCLAEYNKLCSLSNDQDCYLKVKNRITSKCRTHIEKIVNSDAIKKDKKHIEIPKSLQKCYSNVQKKCKLNREKASENPSVAINTYNSCMKKVMESDKECKNQITTNVKSNTKK